MAKIVKKSGKTEKPVAKAKASKTTIAEASEYNGRPVFRIAIEGEEFPKFACGLGKAKHILNHLDELKSFVESEGKSVE